MKTIEVTISACHGFGCCGGSYDSEETIKIKVSNKAAATISRMLDQCNARGGVLNEEVFEDAIEAGHKELNPALEAIDDKHSDMVARYWLFEDDNEYIDEALEPYFWKDIEEGVYAPEVSLEEYKKDYERDDDYAIRFDYYNEYRDKYLEWVNGHDDDYWFIAERTGLDLEVVYEDKPALEFVISGVK